jgi:pimeloyl-ACP methyl ester carboxylesterase
VPGSRRPAMTGTVSGPGRLSRTEFRQAMAAPRFDGSLASRYVVVDGRRVHYRLVAGAPPGPVPMVCLHGLAVSHRYFAPLARALGARRPVYVPDLPGFGLSDKPSGVLDAVQLAAHVARWWGTLGLPPVCVLGHSFGAEVAAALAADHPKVVAALVLAGPTSDPAARTRTRQVWRWLRDVPREAPRQGPVLVRDVRDAGPRRVWATLTRSVDNPVEETLTRVRQPTLVLGGARDPIAPDRWRAEVARLVPHAHQVTVPRAAHNVVTTAAKQVADAVDGFLAAHHADGRSAVRKGGSARCQPSRQSSDGRCEPACGPISSMPPSTTHDEPVT